MQSNRSRRHQSASQLMLRPSLPLIMLSILLVTIWVAGGAARGDVLGQVVVRSVAWLLLIIAAIIGPRPSWKPVMPVVWLLSAAIALCLIQLVPLPPALWQMLPGRALVIEAASASGQPQPWRPWSIVPWATANAVSSLVVPATILLLVSSLTEREQTWLPGVVLALIVASMLLGLLQVTGVSFDNPFINDTPGQISGNFANRNHFALFLSFGCLLTPVWTFLAGHRLSWRKAFALGLLLLLVLTTLATGSRAGLFLGLLALSIGFLIIRTDMMRMMANYPRWALPTLAVGVAAVLLIVVLVSFSANRAESINRVFEGEASNDMRARALPIVFGMIREYFPAGSGFGGFDPVFRIHEPMNLLKYTYFNHAHNDILEIVLDGGLAGLLILFAGLSWVIYASIRVWRVNTGVRFALPKAGAGMLLLTVIASMLDYPARSPMIMAMIVIAGAWLSQATKHANASALPAKHQHL
jgi:O-antigen ligase